MLNMTRQSNIYPDIKVIKYLTADALTGDGIFANTDLIRVPVDGWLLFNIIGDDITAKVEVPQLNHKPNIWNYVLDDGSGLTPDFLRSPNYKIKCPAGTTPSIMYDDAGTACMALGCFYAGANNPVAINTPDIVVVNHFTNNTTSITNALDDTDLEDVPYSGWLYTWVTSDQIDTEVQVRQRNHRTGNVSIAPSILSGTMIDISKVPPFKEWIPKGGQPTVTIARPTSAIVTVVSAFFVR